MNIKDAWSEFMSDPLCKEIEAEYTAFYQKSYAKLDAQVFVGEVSGAKVYYSYGKGGVFRVDQESVQVDLPAAINSAIKQYTEADAKIRVALVEYQKSAQDRIIKLAYDKAGKTEEPEATNTNFSANNTVSPTFAPPKKKEYLN